MSMFEKATRLKLRFATTKGLITVEDLWDLPLTSSTGRPNLDDIALDLHRRLKSDEGISFVTKKIEVDPALVLQFEIVKHVITARLAEDDARAQAAANREKKQQIMQILTQRENETLMGTSIEDLRKMLDAL